MKDPFDGIVGHVQALDQRGLGGVGACNESLFDFAGAGAQKLRENPSDGLHRSLERQLTDE